MSSDLPAGIHEALVTESLHQRIEELRSQGWGFDQRTIDDADLPAIIARFLHDEIQRAVASFPSSQPDRRLAQVDLANRLLSLLREAGSTNQRVHRELQLLLEVKQPLEPASTSASAPVRRPGVPLRSSALLVNGHRDLQIGQQVALELASADRVELLCAFVRFAGIRLILAELRDFLLRGGDMRVIASVYTGSTEKRALDELVYLGAAVKVSYDTARTRLHAKAWLFERNTGFDTAYVGSSNLTQSALLDGLEWNVRLAQTDNPLIIERIRTTFDQYWNDPEFEPYDPRTDGDRLQKALNAQLGSAVDPVLPVSVDLEPKPFQLEILEALSAERDRGHFRNLVVAPTGTGKTWVSAFDYKRLRAVGYERLLFVAHRDEILRQSQAVYQLVLGDAGFGERHAGGERPAWGEHVFASIQSIHRGLSNISPDAFDVVVVDEFHHAEAATYRKLLTHLQPRVLLGLTATPERADGREIHHWFDDRVASEMRLWHALDQGLLCPFHYLGIGDGTDLRGVAFERGRYVATELEDVLTGDHIRAKRIIASINEWVLDPTEMRALGFCAGVNHAKFMAEQLTSAGYPSVALDGSTQRQQRIDAVSRLRRGEIRAIFTVDIFNEGVDIPEVDTILLLRPTESATVFLQQLGRGLRWAPGKSVLTVLDFIGQAHADYRFDVRYRALVGGTRRQLEGAIEAGFPLMPPGCVIKLDEIAAEIVLANVRSSIRNTRRGLIDELRSMPPSTTLAEFLAATTYELTDIYASPGSGTTFTSARRAARHLPSDQTSPGNLDKALGRLLHVDDDERYAYWSQLLQSAHPPGNAPIDTRDGRLQLMLFAALGFRGRPVEDRATALAELWEADHLRAELMELLDVVRDQSRMESQPLDPSGLVPIHSHATYALYELIASYGLISKGLLRENREGLAWAEAERTDLLFVTLNKSESHYSPTTRYQDYPISPTLFHWETQSKANSTSGNGFRYINHERLGTRVVLFVREDRTDSRGVAAPYICLGPARYVSHRSERPVQITWELDRPMPADMFQRAKLAAG